MKLANSQMVTLVCVAPVLAKANSRSDVKRNGRSQNRRLQKGCRYE
jgi:hypothetical protein